MSSTAVIVPLLTLAVCIDSEERGWRKRFTRNLLVRECTARHLKMQGYGRARINDN